MTGESTHPIIVITGCVRRTARPLTRLVSSPASSPLRMLIPTPTLPLTPTPHLCFSGGTSHQSRGDQAARVHQRGAPKAGQDSEEWPGAGHQGVRRVHPQHRGPTNQADQAHDGVGAGGVGVGTWGWVCGLDLGWERG